MSPEQTRQAVAARVASLVPHASYRQLAGDRWHEAETPLMPEWEPAYSQHLAFTVDDRTVDDMLAAHAGIGIGGYDALPQVIAPIIVRFVAGQRPGKRLADWDAASTAARHLLAHLLADWTHDVSLRSGGAGLITRRPVASDGSPWLLVEVRLVASYELSLDLDE